MTIEEAFDIVVITKSYRHEIHREGIGISLMVTFLSLLDAHYRTSNKRKQYLKIFLKLGP